MKLPILITLAAAALAGQTFPGPQSQEIKVPADMLVRLYKNVAEWMNVQRNYETKDMQVRAEIEKWCSDHHASVGQSKPDASGQSEMTCIAKSEPAGKPATK